MYEGRKIIIPLHFFKGQKKKEALDCIAHINNERKTEQAHIPHAPTLLVNAVYNEWEFQA